MKPVMNLALPGVSGASIAPAELPRTDPTAATPTSVWCPGQSPCLTAPTSLTDAGSVPRSDGSAKTVIATALFDERDILLDVPAKGKRSALARIAARLGERTNLSQAAILAAMLRRERLGSTAIGHGVAIPHARLDGLTRPKAVIATLQHPIWFDAPDHESIDLLLALLWPRSDNSGFLPALASICRLLRDSGLRECLRISQTPGEVLAWMEAFENRAMAASVGEAGMTAICAMPSRYQPGKALR